MDKTYMTPPLPTKKGVGNLDRYLQGEEVSVDTILDETISLIYWTLVEGLKYTKGDFVYSYQGGDIKEWLFEVEQNTDKNDLSELQARLIDQATQTAAERLAKLRNKANLAMLKAFTQIAKYKMWRRGEYSSMEEFLSERFGQLLSEGNTGEIYEVSFIISNILPAMKEFDKSNAKHILNNPEVYAKVRAIAPAARAAEKQFENDVADSNNRLAQLEQEERRVQDLTKSNDAVKAKEAAQALEFIQEAKKIIVQEVKEVTAAAEEKLKDFYVNTIEILGNKEIPAEGPNGARELSKKGLSKKVVEFKGEVMYMNGKAYFLVAVDMDYERSVVSQLKHFVNFTVTDALAVYKKLGNLLPKSTKG